MKNIEKKLNIIFKQYPIICAYLFGSQATGKVAARSDYDFAVYFKHTADKGNREDAIFEIQTKLEKKLNAYDKVDVVLLNDAQPLLEHQVVYEGKLIYSNDEEKRAHYEAQAISRWLDWKFHQDKLDKARKKQFGKPIKPYKIYV